MPVELAYVAVSLLPEKVRSLSPPMRAGVAELEVNTATWFATSMVEVATTEEPPPEASLLSHKAALPVISTQVEVATHAILLPSQPSTCPFVPVPKSVEVEGKENVVAVRMMGYVAE